MPSQEIPLQFSFPELVDIATAAQLLAVDVRKMRRMVALRGIGFVKVGRLLRFDLAELRAWVEANRVPSAS